MRKIKGGVLNLANQIEEELSRRDLKLSLPQRRALSDISASILSCQRALLHKLTLSVCF